MATVGQVLHNTMKKLEQSLKIFGLVHKLLNLIELKNLRTVIQIFRITGEGPVGAYEKLWKLFCHPNNSLTTTFALRTDLFAFTVSF